MISTATDLVPLLSVAAAGVQSQTFMPFVLVLVPIGLVLVLLLVLGRERRRKSRDRD